MTFNADMSAYPLEGERWVDSFDPNKGTTSADGLTKREYFAGLAMQGLSTATSEDGTWQHDPKDCAIAAVEYADALLAELEKTK